MKREFAPFRECPEASGDCITAGKCLSQCRNQGRKDRAVKTRELERRLAKLELIVYGLRLHEKYGIEKDDKA